MYYFDLDYSTRKLTLADQRKMRAQEANLLKQQEMIKYCQEIIDGKHNYYAGDNNLLSGDPSDAGL